MTGFACLLLPSFVPPKVLKLDHRRSWSSILLSMKRGRGTWYTTWTEWRIFQLQNQIWATILVHPHPHLSSYGIKTSPRTSPTTPSRRNMPHIPQQILFFDARSEPFLSENLNAEQTQRNSLLFHELLTAMSASNKRNIRNYLLLDIATNNDNHMLQKFHAGRKIPCNRNEH